MRQTQRSPEGPRHLHRIPRLSEAPWDATRLKTTGRGDDERIRAVKLPFMAFPDGSVLKNPPANAEDVSLIPELGRSPGEGKGVELCVEPAAFTE